MNKIVRDILDYSEKNSKEYELLENKKSTQLIESVAVKYGFDLSKLWLWDGIAINDTANYSNHHEWDKAIKSMLLYFNLHIYLVITDDEFFPWPVIKLRREDLVEILEEQQTFEYFIFDSTLNTILFDTHHSELYLIKTDVN